MPGRTQTCSAFVLAGALSLVAVSATNAAAGRSPAKQSLPPTTGAPAEPPRPLQPGTPLERSLTATEAHTYLLTLAAGQSAHVLIDQRGIELVAALFGPSGQKMAAVDSENAILSIWVVAEEAGRFRLDVRALNTWAGPGRYEIRVEDMRPTDAQDRLRMSAQRARTEAEELVGQGSSESFRRAIPKYTEALDAWRSVKDTAGEEDALLNLARVHLLLRQNETALGFYREALRLFRASGNQDREAPVLVGIGWIYSGFGEYQNALDHFSQALALFRARGVRSMEATTLSSMGLVYAQLGEPRHALEFYGQGLELYRALNNRNGEASALHGLGQIHTSLREYPKALEQYGQALRLFRASGNRRREAQSLASIGWVHALMGERPQALTRLSEALSLSRTVGDRGVEAQALHNLGAVSHASGQRAQALEYYRQALPLRRTLGDRAGEASTLSGLARVERDAGNFAEARAHIEAALDRIESLRTAVARQELRSSYLASKQDEYGFYIDLLMQLHRREPGRGHDAAALEASERARARGLLEMLVEARADIRGGADPALLDRERSLQREINVRERARVQLLSGKHGAAEEAALQQELDGLLSSYRDVQSQIRAASPRYAALTQPRPLDATGIRGLLDGNTMVLEYALGEERSFLWAVTNTSLRSYELPARAEIEKPARRLFELLRSGRDRIARTQIELAARELSGIVLSPVASQLGRKRLLIVSDGVLQYVPFGILADPAPAGGTDRPAWQPLIVRHDVLYLPSASTLALLREESVGRVTAAKTVAVFSDPVFDPADPRVDAAGRRREVASSPGSTPPARDDATGPLDVERSAIESGVPRFERLPFSRREADAIVALAPAGQAFKAVDFAASRATATRADLIQVPHRPFRHARLDQQHPPGAVRHRAVAGRRARPAAGRLPPYARDLQPASGGGSGGAERMSDGARAGSQG